MLGIWLFSIGKVVRDAIHIAIGDGFFAVVVTFTPLLLPGTHDILEIKRMWSNNQQMIEY